MKLVSFQTKYWMIPIVYVFRILELLLSELPVSH